MLCCIVWSGRTACLVSGDDAVEPDHAVADHEALVVAPDVVGSCFQDGAAHGGGEDAVEAREKLRAGADLRSAGCAGHKQWIVDEQRHGFMVIALQGIL